MVIKKNGIIVFAATWIDLEIITVSEVSQTESQISYHLYVESLKKKNIQMNLLSKETENHRHRKQS